MTTKKKTQKSKQTAQVGEAIPLVLTMGELDLIFKINFKDEDLEKSSKEAKDDDKYYKLEDLSDIKSLSFLKDKEELWNRIKLCPGNENIKLLLMGGKNCKKKCFIDYIPYGRPKFEGDEEYNQ